MGQETKATVIPISSCERCKQLEARLEAVQTERDELLLSVARERQRANAVMLQFPTQPLIVHVPVVSSEPPPLRHRLADQVNDAIKRFLPFAHGAAKRVGNKVD